MLDRVFHDSRPADHRGLLRLARAPRPAGARRRGRARPQGRVRRPLDGPQHGHRPRPRLPHTCPPDVLVDAKELADLPARAAGADLDRLPGRAAVGAVAGSPSATTTSCTSRRATPSSSPSSLIPGNENAVYRVINGLARLGRQRRAQGQRAGARLRPRQRRRAALLLQHRQAAQRDAGARRDPAHAAPTPSWRRRPASTERRDRRGRRRRRPGRRAWPKIAGKVDCGYVFVDGSLGRRHHRVRPQGPPDPRRGGLHLGDRGDRLGQTGKVVQRPRDPRPRLRRGRHAPSTRSSSRSSTRSTRRSARASTTPTSSSRTIRRVVGRWVNSKHRRRPMIIPVVIEA